MNGIIKPVLILLILIIFILNVYVHAQNDWEDPNITGINKELPHAHYIPYASIYQALDPVPSESPWYLSLNGTWKFFIRKNLDEYMWFYFWEDKSNLSDWDDIEVPANWELQGFGVYVGYSQGSKTPAEFHVSDLLKDGTNTLAVQVYRYSDGSYLKGQDYWKISGIERDVFLYAVPNTQVRDFFAHADLDENYENGIFDLEVD